MNNDDLSCAWWRDPAALQRVVADLLAHEMAQLRPGRTMPAAPWPAGFDLRADLAADSLDLMGLATALETLLQLAPATDAPLLARTRLVDWLAFARAGLEEGGSQLTFRTSGSSGAPKPCTHPLAWLVQEAGVLATLFAGRRRIVSLVGAHHIYGFLFTVLLPRHLALEDAVYDLRRHAPGALAAQLRPGDLVIGFPDAWRALAQVAQVGAVLPPDVVGVTSTAPMPPEVAQAVLAGGLARLVQVYGSSETAGIGWRDDPDGDYLLFPYWARAAGDRLQRTAADGARHEAVLQDRLDWRTPERFRPAGRIDQAVQVGGINVFPAYIAQVLVLHPAVQWASVRLMRADEGQRLKAFVVPRASEADPAFLRTDLQAWLAERLSAPECPAAISFGPRLPRQASGKLADWIIDTCD